MPKAKKTSAKTRRRVAPKSVPIEQSLDYRKFYSDLQFVHLDGDLMAIYFLSSERRYPALKLEYSPDGTKIRVGGPTEEQRIQIEEACVKMPISQALSLAALIGDKVANIGPEGLKKLGIAVELMPVKSLPLASVSVVKKK